MSIMSYNPDDNDTIDAIGETEDKTHNFIVFIYGLSIAILACIVNDLSLIFGFFAAFAETFNDFFLPSILLICALRYK